MSDTDMTIVRDIAGENGWKKELFGELDCLIFTKGEYKVFAAFDSFGAFNSAELFRYNSWQSSVFRELDNVLVWLRR